MLALIMGGLSLMVGHGRPGREPGTSRRERVPARLGGARAAPAQPPLMTGAGWGAPPQTAPTGGVSPYPPAPPHNVREGVRVEHRPRVYAEHLNLSLFRQPGWYWRFECACGYRAPYGLIMTWWMAMRFANTHVGAARLRTQQIDVEVAKFRTQLDAA